MAQAASASAQRAAAWRKQKAAARPRTKRPTVSRTGIRWDRVARAALLGTLGIVLLLYISPLHRWLTQRSLAQQQKARLAREAKSKAEAEALATHLQALPLSIAKKTGEGERLYGSVTSMDIADLLKARGVSLDRRRIVLDTPLKTLGTHRVPIRLHPEVIAEVEVAVTKEI